MVNCYYYQLLLLFRNYYYYTWLVFKLSSRYDSICKPQLLVVITPCKCRNLYAVIHHVIRNQQLFTQFPLNNHWYTPNISQSLACIDILSKHCMMNMNQLTISSWPNTSFYQSLLLYHYQSWFTNTNQSVWYHGH